MFSRSLAGTSGGVVELVQLRGSDNVVKGSFNVGGLIGLQLTGYIRKSSAVVTVMEYDTNGSNSLGGLVGSLRGHGTFASNTFVRSTVSAPNSLYVGGSIGHLRGSISYSYAISNVSAGATRAGVFIGSSSEAGNYRVAFSFAIPVAVIKLKLFKVMGQEMITFIQNISEAEQQMGVFQIMMTSHAVIFSIQELKIYFMMIILNSLIMKIHGSLM